MYDVIIVGAGPSGTFAAKVLAQKGLKILVIEKGQPIIRRKNLINGWFGRGLYVMDYMVIKDPILKKQRAINEVVKTIQGVTNPKNIQLDKKNKTCILSPQVSFELANYLFESISSKSDIIFDSGVNEIKINDSFFEVITKKKTFCTKKCLISVGGFSLDWLDGLINNLNIQLSPKKSSLGIRVEVPTNIVKEMLDDQKEIIIQADGSFTKDTRKNCFVGEWCDSNIISAMGHCLPTKKSQSTNFMIGVDLEHDEAVRSAKIVNVLVNDKLRQEKVEDFVGGKTILRNMKEFKNMKGTFNKLEKTFPNFIENSIIHIPELQPSGILTVNDKMETSITNLYACGECTSAVSNISGAMASGLIAARSILES